MLNNRYINEVCQPVPHGLYCDDLAACMLSVIARHRAAGLAANQIGDLRRVIYIQLPINGCAQAIINPEITYMSENQIISLEGCLSFPGVIQNLMRSAIVTVKGFNLDWSPYEKQLRGLAAICAQHEIDHLNGLTVMRNIK